MNAELFQQIEAQGGCVRLARACFRLTGGDRVRYLNGQVTNDVRTANDRATLYACITDLKGRIVGDVFIHPRGDALFLDAEADLREVLGPRLERYIIADDAELTDVSDDWQLWHVFGKAAESMEAGAGSEGQVLQSNRLGIPGLDIWLPADARFQASCSELSSEDFETYRILRGIPRYPNELNAEAFPPEVGIEERAMSYTKGCYIGQEILSRIRSTGKMPRTLLHWQSGEAVSVGDDLLLEDKMVGRITSVTKHPVQPGCVGLAYVKQGAHGAFHTASGATLTSGAS
jgi:folate-binding protein YgfZ